MTRLTVRDIQKMKVDGEAIPVLTAYDAPSAKICDLAGVPIILVGDSLGMVVQGHETPIPVTLEHMIYHASMVSRVAKHALIVGDLPFMTYNASIEQAMISSGRLMQEGGVNAVKLEGGVRNAETIDRIVKAGIPVMGHIGLTPQSVNQLGGMRVQGRELDGARELLADAKAVEEAGAFAIVLESMPAPLGEMITSNLKIPTIGIGAGPGCDGQVQVWHDILGIFDDFLPRHTRRYAELSTVMRDAVTAYVEDVKAHQFPTADNSFSMKDEVLNSLRTNGSEQHAGH
ncbi:MAG: 3-methyl-2-oxobutanoate hydroxymethyltransferase [Anaerolineae bacterium]